jgi:hypothetical protein
LRGSDPTQIDEDLGLHMATHATTSSEAGVGAPGLSDHIQVEPEAASHEGGMRLSALYYTTEQDTGLYYKSTILRERAYRFVEVRREPTPENGPGEWSRDRSIEGEPATKCPSSGRRGCPPCIAGHHAEDVRLERWKVALGGAEE